jgi:hypothetical protein
LSNFSSNALTLFSAHKQTTDSLAIHLDLTKEKLEKNTNHQTQYFAHFSSNSLFLAQHTPKQTIASCSHLELRHNLQKPNHSTSLSSHLADRAPHRQKVSANNKTQNPQKEKNRSTLTCRKTCHHTNSTSSLKSHLADHSFDLFELYSNIQSKREKRRHKNCGFPFRQIFRFFRQQAQTASKSQTKIQRKQTLQN